MPDQTPPCLRIAVTLPVRETFTYLVSDDLAPAALVGCRVKVPFGRRRVVGYILEEDPSPPREGLKEILEVLDPDPLFPAHLAPFFRWMSDYYRYPLGRLIQSALPGGLNAQPFFAGRITEKGLAVTAVLPPRSAEREQLLWVRDHPGKRFSFPLSAARALQKRGWLVLEGKKGRRRAGPLKRKFVRPARGAELDPILEDKAGELRARGEADFLKAVFAQGAVPLGALCSRFENASYLVRKWVRKGLLEDYREVVLRNPSGDLLTPAPAPARLLKQQEEVLQAVGRRLTEGRFATCLLHGVTGSGKTEVYLRAVQQVVGLGRQAILMVPEIALAMYMEGIFRARFEGEIGLFHSGLSEGERYDTWMRAARGEVNLVIGARSALFAPLPRLGLIIVDEEHDLAYKQDEAPRYQARDAAVVRGKMEKALVLLGSGTPSVQSYRNAATGRYEMLSMPHRVERRPLPEVQLVDMREVLEAGQGGGIISPQLKEALDSTLEEGRQVMLFLNRRGFSRVLLCRFCGQSVRCHNCDLAMTYHLEDNRLLCHYCGFHSPVHEACPSCGLKGMRDYGFGTEKLELELKAMYPAKRIARMDRDSTRRKGRSIQILRRFGRREIDILTGTQMITKGYDFPAVTLVGVIAADFSLAFPDFRSAERTFQILSQVAGRAGRGERTGKVVVQTFTPDHYAIATARDHDYGTFFKKEIQLRRQLGYPPFSYLACLRLRGNSPEGTAAAAQELGRAVTGLVDGWPRRGRELQVLGPVQAPLAKLKGKHRWQIFIKSKQASLLHVLLDQVEVASQRVLRGRGVTLVVDVDPYHML